MILVENRDVIDLILCQECTFQLRQTIRLIAGEAGPHCSLNIHIVHDYSCLKREKETTACLLMLAMETT